MPKHPVRKPRGSAPAAEVEDRLTTRARRILGDAKSFGGLGRHFGSGLTEAEVDYLMEQEWAERDLDRVQSGSLPTVTAITPGAGVGSTGTAG